MAQTTRKILFGDKEYPENLKNISDPPKTIFVNGHLLETDNMAVALVGSRRATHYGSQACERLAFELACRGFTVVSGMARGIDTAAHRGALSAKGRTIAVLGSGHNNIYPPENAGLYEEIVKSGAVISEFENDVPPLPYNFPRRNRLISGLSLGVVVVEAARNSGALITVDYALEQGREVFAVPGQISSGTSSGTNGLIKQGAKLVSNADDIIEELKAFQSEELIDTDDGDKSEEISRKTKAYVYNSLTDNERKVYKVLSDGPLYIDDLATSASIEVNKISDIVLKLQLKGIIEELPGKRFARKS